jgi:translocation and assembly module TamA
LAFGWAFALLARPAGAALEVEAADASAALLDNVRSHLRLAVEPCDAPAWRVRRLFNRVEEDVRPALRAFGYYRPAIDKTLERDEKCWLAKITIDLGEPVRVRTLDLRIEGEADRDPRFRQLREQLPLQPGDQLHHGRYEQIKSRLTDLAFERGYLDAVFKRQELRVYPAADVADIHLDLDSGKRYAFGTLHMSEHPLDDRLIEGLAGWRIGEPYDIKTLFDLDRRLSDSGYFRSVDVRPRREAAEDHVIPVDVDLTALPRHAWRAGIGYETDTGPRIRLDYTNRFVNTRGHKLQSELRLSPVISGLSASYIMPGRDPRTETFSFTAAAVHEDTDTLLSDSIRLVFRQILERDAWTETRFLELLHERSTVADEENEDTLLMPGINGERVYTDDPLRTRRGYRLYAEARGAYEGLLSSVSLLQGTAGAKAIYRFGDAGRITGRTDLGATLTSDLSDLPASLRFYAGGDNSVRGYRYQGLGPRNADGEPTGGTYLLTASLEYEHPVVGEDWWAAAFVDGGNTFDDNDLDLKFGYGVGVRWYSPIGRVRVDVAIPGDKFEDNWRLHFSVGADL